MIIFYVVQDGCMQLISQELPCLGPACERPKTKLFSGIRSCFIVFWAPGVIP